MRKESGKRVMKTVYGKFKRMLSVLLATALVLTCVPQTGMQVFAAESDAEAVVSEDGQMTEEEAPAEEQEKQKESEEQEITEENEESEEEVTEEDEELKEETPSEEKAPEKEQDSETPENSEGGGITDDPVEEEIEEEINAAADGADEGTETNPEEPDTPPTEDQTTKYTLTVNKGENAEQIKKISYAYGDSVPADTEFTEWADTPVEIPENKTVYLKVISEDGFDVKIKQQYQGGDETEAGDYLEKYDCYQFFMSKDLTLTVSAETAKKQVRIQKNSTDGFESVYYSIDNKKEGTEDYETGKQQAFSGTSVSIEISSDQQLTLSVKTKGVNRYRVYVCCEDNQNTTYVPSEDGNEEIYHIEGKSLRKNDTVNISAIKLYWLTVEADTNSIKEKIESIWSVPLEAADGDTALDEVSDDAFSEEWDVGTNGGITAQTCYVEQGEKTGAVFFKAKPKDDYEIKVTPETKHITSIVKDGAFYYKIVMPEPESDETYTISAVPKPQCSLTIPDFSGIKGIESVKYATELKEDPAGSGTSVPDWKEYTASTYPFVKRGEKIYLQVNVADGYDAAETKIYTTYGTLAEDKEPVTAEADGSYVLTMKDGLSLRIVTQLKSNTITVTKDADVKNVYYTIDNDARKTLGATEEIKATRENMVTLEFAMEDGFGVAVTKTSDGGSAEPLETTYDTYSGNYECELKDITADVAVNVTSVSLATIHMPETFTGTGVKKVQYATQETGGDSALTWYNAVAGETIRVPASGMNVYLLVTPETGRKCIVSYGATWDADEASQTDVPTAPGKNYYDLTSILSSAPIWLFMKQDSSTATHTLTIKRGGTLAAIRDIAYTMNADDKNSWVSVGSAKEIPRLAKDSVVYVRTSVKPGYTCSVTKDAGVTPETPDANGVYSITMDADVAITVKAEAAAQTVKYMENLNGADKGAVFLSDSKFTREGADGQPENLKDYAGADGIVTPADPAKPITCEDTLTLSFTPKEGYKVTVTRKTGEAPAGGADDTRKTTEQTYFPGDACKYVITNITADTEITVEAKKIESLRVRGGFSGKHVKEVKYAVGTVDAGDADASADPEVIGKLPGGLTWKTAEDKDNIAITNVGADEKVYLLVLPEDHYVAAASQEAGDPAVPTPLTGKKYTDKTSEKVYAYYGDIALTGGKTVTLTTTPMDYKVIVGRSVSEEGAVVADVFMGGMTYKKAADGVGEDETITPDAPAPDENADSFDFTFGETLIMEFSMKESYKPVVTKKTGDAEQSQTLSGTGVPDAGNIGCKKYTYRISGFTGDTEIAIMAERASYRINSFVKPKVDSGLSSTDITGVVLKSGTSAVENGKEFSIPADSDLTFTVEGVNEGHRLDVTYRKKVEDSPAASRPTDKDAELLRKDTINGKDTYTWRIDASEVKGIGDLTILVEVRKKDGKAVVRTVNAEELSNNHVDKISGEKDGKYTLEIDSIGVEREEDSVFSFKITPQTYYMVDKVTVEDGDGNEIGGLTVNGTGQNAVYSFAVRRGENIISVKTKKDPAQMYQLKLNLVGDQESVDISLEPAGIDADEGGIDPKLETRRNLATLNSAVLVKITPSDKYELLTGSDGKALVSVSGAEGAKITDETRSDEESRTRTYRVNLVSKKIVTLTVKTKAEALTDDATVTFDLDEERAPHVSGLRVDSQENKKGESMVVKGKDGVYTLREGVEKLRFTLDAIGSYSPVVTYNGSEFAAEGNPDRNGDGTKTWRYAVAAARLDRDARLEIGEKEVRKSLRLRYDKDETDVTVKDGNKEIVGTVSGNDMLFSGILEGSPLTIEVNTKQGFGITDITTRKAGADEEEIAEQVENPEAHRFIVDLSESTTVTVGTGEIVWGEKLEEVGGDVITPNVIDEYDVGWDKKYVFSATIGKNTPVAFTRAELWQDQEEIPQGDDEDALWRCTAGGKEAVTRPQISFSDQMDKGKYRLVLFRKDKKEEVVAVTCHLNIYRPLRDDKVQIGAGGDIVQAADTTAYYAVTTNAGASADSIFVAVKEKDPNAENKLPKDYTFDFDKEKEDSVITKQPVIKGGKLEVTTGRVTGDSYWLMFYTQKPGTTAVNGTVDEEDRQYLTKQSGLTSKYLAVKVTAGHLFKENVVPTVKLKSASDVALTFTVGAKNIKKPNRTKVFYEVIVSPQYENRHAGIIKKNMDPVYVEKNGDSQEVTVKVSELEQGSGADCKFDVRVRLVHANLTEDDAIEGNLETTGNNAGLIKEEKVLAAGTAFSKVGFAATRKPAYETKLTLKAVKSTIYTNETAVVAEPKFGKETSWNELEEGTLKDITPGLTDEKKLKVSLEGNQIVATADAGVALGKHTIEVYAVTGHEDMYAARGEVTITVARGIEDITVNLSTDRICKTPKKAAAVKAVASYNQVLQAANEDTHAPKTPKVKWFVVGANTDKKDITGDVMRALRGLAKEKSFKNGMIVLDGNRVAEQPDSLIKISQSGGVTVDKNCGTGVSFKVLALANDYEDSVRFGLSKEIKVTDQPVVLDEVRIMKKDPIVARYSEVRGDKTGAVKAGDLDGTYLMGFLSGMKEQDSYSEEEIRQYRVTQQLTYYSNNTRAVRVNTYTGEITVISPAKNVKLYARTGDGSNGGKNTEKSVIVTVCYDETGELSLDIEKQVRNGEKTIGWRADESNSAGPAYSTVIPFKDSTGAVFKLNVKHKDAEKDWSEIPAYTNYSLSVSGGRLIEWNKKTGEAFVLVNTRQAVVKLTNNETKPKVTKKFLFTNEALEAVKNVKAPKVSYTYANKNVIGAENGIRKVGIALKDNGKNYPLNLYTGRTVAEGEELYAKIELDRAGQNNANKMSLDQFAESLQNLQQRGLEPLTHTNSSLELDFDGRQLKAGNYKLKITVGTVDEDRVFMPKAAPAVVTIKVKKEPKLSFKPTTTYKFSALDCTEVALTGKKASKEMTVDFTGLKNAAKKSSMGQMNAFMTYFELEGDKLKLTDACFKETAGGEWITDIPEDDLVGYVEYEGHYPNTPKNSWLKGAAKVTIKLVDGKTASYTAKSTKADTRAYSVADVTVLRGKQEVAVSYAAVEDADVGNWLIVGRESDESDWEETTLIGGSANFVIQNQQKIADEKIKTAKVTLRVIPGGSHYAKQAEQTESEKRTAFVKKYGIQVKVSVPLSDFNTTAGRIAFDKKYKSLNYQKQGFYDAKEGVYYVEVPYKGVYAGTADQVKIVKVDDSGQFYKNGIAVENVRLGSNHGYLRISVSKDALVKEPGPKDKKWYYTLQGKAPRQWKKPTTFPVKIAVTYLGSGKDEFSFNMTMPTYPYYVTQESAEDGDAYTDFEQVMAYVCENADAFGAAAARLVEIRDYPDICNVDTDDLREEIEQAVKDRFTHVLRYGGYSDAYGDVSGINYDCGIDFDAMKMEVGDGEDYKAPTETASGGVNLEVTFTNGREDAYSRRKRVNFNVRLRPLTDVDVTDVAGHVENFLNNYNTDKKVWDVNKKEVRNSLYAYLGEQGLDEAYISNYRFRITVGQLENEETKAPVTVIIENVTASEEGKQTKEIVEKFVPVGEKPAPQDAVQAVKEALGIEPSDPAKIGTLAASNTQRGVEKAVLAAARGVIDLQLYEIAFVGDVEFTPVSKKDNVSTAGSLSFTLKLTKKGGEELSEEEDPYRGKISLNNQEIKPPLKLLELTEAETAVEKWIIKNTLTAEEDVQKSEKVLKGNTSAERILTSIRKDTVPEGSGVLVAFNTKRNAAGSLISDIRIKNATVNAEGSVRGVLKLTKDEDGEEKTALVEIDVVIPMLSQNAEEACVVIRSALDRPGAVRIPAGTQDGDKTVTEMILNKAETAKGLKENTFSIEVSDNGELTITPATEAEEGTAEITLHVWKTQSGYASGEDLTIRITIPASAT